MKTFALSIISLFGFLSIQAQWIALESNTTYNLNDVHFVDHLHGFAVGQNGRMTATIDGGETWVESTPFPACNSRTITFTTADSGWVGGSCGIYFTSNGGGTWTLQSPLVQGINDLFFLDSKHGWAACDNLQTMRTTDGGTTWHLDSVEVHSTPNNPTLAIHFKGKMNGWVVGGVLPHYSTDGGDTWIKGSSLLIDWLYDLDFGTDNIGIGGGMAGSVTNTFDWGSNWDFNGSITLNIQTIYGIDFIDDESAYLVGDDGLIYVTNNAGTSYESEESGITTDLRSVYFVHENLGYVVGTEGTIIRKGDPSPSGLAEATTSTEPSINLYPNPSDGTFNLKLETNSARLYVYNQHGRLIKDEQMNNGNSFSLPQGFYSSLIVTDAAVVQQRLISK